MRVRSVTPRHVVSASGAIIADTGVRLRPRLDSDGYQIVSLWYDGKYDTAKVHHLVLRAWVGPRPSKDHEADHINGKRADNRASNLRWATKSENRRNQHGAPRAASGVRGVRFRAGRDTWQAYGRAAGRWTHIGCFAKKRQAVLAKNKWEAQRAAC